MPTGFLLNLNIVASCHAVPNFTKAQPIGHSFGLYSCSISRLISNFGFSIQRNRLFVTQAFGYPRNCQFQTSMATSGTKAAGGELLVDNLISSCGNVPNFVKPSGVYFSDRSFRHCQKATLGLKNRAAINSRSSYASYRFHCTRRSSLVGPMFNGLHTSSVQCYSDGAVPSVSLDGLTYDEQLQNSAISTDQNILSDRSLKLQSGSCYLPHPDKERTGGEDAHFICEDQQAIGVADGVGGWADVGVDAGIFARALMDNSVAAIWDEPKGFIDPARVLEKAHSVTKEKGSSTACIITLEEQTLHAINLGDSGFILIRDGCTIFESPVQQHGFNFTYQLESSNTGDLPSSGQVFMIPIVPGDVIVAGTDGLFDNLYNNEITAVVAHGLNTGLRPQETAQKIAALARQRALDRHRQTPFSTAAQEAGYRYYGGKLDDTTVVVSYVTNLSSM